MADTFLFRNNAVSTLLSPITNIATSIFLQTGEGLLFPTPVAGQRFAATLTNAAGDIEIVYCTDQPNADELTVVRGQEGTTPLAWSAGDSISMRLTMGVMLQVLQGDANVIADTNADMVDGIDANTVATANELLALDGSAQLPATAYNSILLDGQTLAYVLGRANHTGVISKNDLPGPLSHQFLFAPGTFTVPLNVSRVICVMAGGGGGGGAGGDADYGGGGNIGVGFGGGGGSSGQIQQFDINVSGGQVFNVTQIGVGGAGAINTAGFGIVDNGSPGTGTIMYGLEITAGNFVIGRKYQIVSLNDTDFTLIGASVNIIGTIFTATGDGTTVGTPGTADEYFDVDGGAGGIGGDSHAGPTAPLSQSAGSRGEDTPYGFGGPGAPAALSYEQDGYDAPARNRFMNLGHEGVGGSGAGGGGGGGATQDDTSPSWREGGNGSDGFDGFVLFYW